MNKIDTYLDLYQSLTLSQRALIRAFQWLSRKFRDVYCSIDKLSQIIRFHRATIFRGLKILCQLGWLAIKNQGHHKTNLYFLDEDLKHFDFEKELRQRNIRHRNENATSVRRNCSNNMCSKESSLKESSNSSENKENSADPFPSWFPKRLKIPALSGLKYYSKKFFTDLSDAVIDFTINDCQSHYKAGLTNNLSSLILRRLQYHKERCAEYKTRS